VLLKACTSRPFSHDGRFFHFENVEIWPAARIRARLSDLRHDILHIRRTLGPTRDAVRNVFRAALATRQDVVTREADLFALPRVPAGHRNSYFVRRLHRPAA